MGSTSFFPIKHYSTLSRDITQAQEMDCSSITLPYLLLLEKLTALVRQTLEPIGVGEPRSDTTGPASSAPHVKHASCLQYSGQPRNTQTILYPDYPHSLPLAT